MYYLLLILMVTVRAAPVASLVSCRDACVNCRQELVEPGVLEVYCSMCKECVLRRRQLVSDKLRPSNNGHSFVKPLESSEDYNDISRIRRKSGGHYSSGCPTPPFCESEEGSYEEVPMKTTKMATSSTCPPITTCRKKKKKPEQQWCTPCVPYFPMCTCKPTGTNGPATATSPFDQYVYLGVPKNIPLRRTL